MLFGKVRLRCVCVMRSTHRFPNNSCERMRSCAARLTGQSLGGPRQCPAKAVVVAVTPAAASEVMFQGSCCRSGDPRRCACLQMRAQPRQACQARQARQGECACLPRVAFGGGRPIVGLPFFAVGRGSSIPGPHPKRKNTSRGGASSRCAGAVPEYAEAVLLNPSLRQDSGTCSLRNGSSKPVR